MVVALGLLANPMGQLKFSHVPAQQSSSQQAESMMLCASFVVPSADRVVPLNPAPTTLLDCPHICELH
jgi:hypothetical protein